jgi:hypothetical protein
VPTPIYTDRAVLPEGRPHTAMLFPFWGKNPEDPDDPNTGRFDRYVEVGPELFRLAPLEEAEFAVVPFDWSNEPDEELVAAAQAFAARAQEAGKPVIVFYVSDADDAVPVDGAIVLRTSMYESTRRPGEFAQPAWSEDFLERYYGGELPVRTRGRQPVVGFCGLAPRVQRRLLRWRERASPASDVRARVLQVLRDAPGVRSNFTIRSAFLGGAIVNGRVDPAAMLRVRREYVENMADSDYVVCARGAGNFSYRLYETLSLGRIPVFVNTDCVLPFDFEIDWRDYVVWVDESEVERAGEIVTAFHERLSDSEFEELQRACRRLWEERISPQGFFAHLDDHLARV